MMNKNQDGEIDIDYRNRSNGYYGGSLRWYLPPDEWANNDYIQYYGHKIITSKGVSIQNVLSLIAQNEDTERLGKKLEGIINNFSVKNDEIHILTKLGTEIIIKHIYGDYNLYIHPVQFYEFSLGDNPFKLYSLDRVTYYLNKICEEEGK